MRILLVLHTFAFALGCGGPATKLNTTDPLAGEKVELAFKNASRQSVMVQPWVWTNGGEQPVGDPKQVDPGAMLKWAPFLDARKHIAREPSLSGRQWLSARQPSTDYSLQIYELDSDGKKKQLARERFSYEHLLEAVSQPSQVNVENSAVGFTIGTQKRTAKY